MSETTTPERFSAAQASKSTATKVRYEVLSLLAVAAGLSYLARNAVGVAESTIRTDLGLTLKESGWFMGTFFWSYAILQIPGGELAHQRGTKLAMLVFATGWSVASLCIGLAPGIMLLLTAQLIMGAAQAGIFPASCSSVSHWIPVARRTFACACLAVGMQLGAITASLLTGPLIDVMKWRWVFVLYAVPGFVWAVIFWRRFHNDPHQDDRVNTAERDLIGGSEQSKSRQQKRTVPTPWGAVARNPAVWFLCGQQVCRASGYMFFASWFPTFLQETRGTSISDSGYLQALVFSGTLTGSLCGGLLTDWIYRRTGNLKFSRSGVGATFLMGCAALILAAWFVENTVLAVGLLALGSLFAALAGPCAFAATIDIGGDHVPQVFGLMNMTGNLAAAACPILVGLLFDWTSNWTLVLLIFAAIYAVGGLCWALVDCERSISKRSEP
jgi:ACS family glucarate transporter-like MFS transporter/ACS family D-galactonate transporter-like MFS transporter